MATRAGMKAPTASQGEVELDHNNEDDSGAESQSGAETTAGDQPEPEQPAPGPDAVTMAAQAATEAENRAALFERHRNQARADNAAMELAMEAVRAVRKRRNRNRNLCSTDGFPLQELDKILSDEGRPIHELEQEAEVRTFMRTTAALPVLGPQQLSLFGVEPAAAPPARTDADSWRAEGYRIALTGADAKAQETVPGEFMQAFMEGWGDGTAVLGSRLKKAEEIESAREFG